MASAHLPHVPPSHNLRAGIAPPVSSSVFGIIPVGLIATGTSAKLLQYCGNPVYVSLSVNTDKVIVKIRSADIETVVQQSAPPPI